MKKLYIFLTLVVSLIPLEAFAWGPAGHHLVAEIAQARISQNIRDSVNKYLAGMSFDDASTWMDDMRSDHSYDYMTTWHYINIEKGKTYAPGENEPNCVFELQRVIKELSSRSKLSKDQINTDIKVLFHLVGDIGQPLHSGYADDKGGNSIHVDFHGKKSNLHRVWDTDIILYKKISVQSCQSAGTRLTSSELATSKTMDIVNWVNFSRNLLSNVYSFNNEIIDDSYIDKNAPIIEKQLFISGTRLANALTQIFSK